VGDEQAEQWVPKRVSEADVAAGVVLRRQRERAGLTLDQAAEASRISKAVLSRTERGERPARVTEPLPLAAACDMTGAELAAAIAADPAVSTAASSAIGTVSAGCMEMSTSSSRRCRGHDRVGL